MIITNIENKKYKLTNKSIEYKGKKLYQIVALVNFNITNNGFIYEIKKGDLGGFIEKESINLSQLGSCWVYNNAIVADNAEISGAAQVFGSAQVKDFSKVNEAAQVFGRSKLLNNCLITENSKVEGNAIIRDNTIVCGGTTICESADISGDALISSNYDYVVIKGYGSLFTFFKCSDAKIRVKTNSFYGTLKEFKNLVRLDKYGYMQKEKLMLASFIKITMS